MNVARFIRRKLYGPRIKIEGKSELLRLGSQYGGWVLVPNESLKGATILSCGLGEDASFDVEIAKLYDARVVIVDPTPRAIQHFNAIMAQMGKPRASKYSKDGCQRIESYELSGLNSDQFSLVQAALSHSNGHAKFFSPPNPSSVSYSLVNFQNNYSATTQFIEVPTIDIATLISQENLSHIALAKFDIEGAEIQVIPLMLTNGIFPDQILVEYDELNFPSARSRRNFNSVNQLLVKAGYTTTWFDGRSCVSYQLSASIG
jgi:FkbM family methyltransferase